MTDHPFKHRKREMAVNMTKLAGGLKSSQTSVLTYMSVFDFVGRKSLNYQAISLYFYDIFNVISNLTLIR